MVHPEISVVIPAWNGHRTIVDCLDSIRRAAQGRRVETIVVESSGDPARELIRDRFPEVTLIATEARMQVGSARNLGASQARSEWICFVDQDCTVPADWFDRLLAHAADPAVGAVGGSISVRNPKNLSGLGVYFLEFFRHLPHGGAARESTEFLLGANLLVRRTLFAEVQFPNQTLGEDVLFCAAVRKAGFRVIYAPAIPVGHWNRTGWREFFRYNRCMGVAAADYHWELQMSVSRHVRRFPHLIFLTPPLTLLGILRRLVESRSSLLLKFVFLSPACLAGNLCWALAFCRRIQERQSLESGPDLV